uniref:Uncharacterized protein n=1 Tax=Monopterus albus TaxID=43700 RepID=A0A3Q3ISB3_MONAL
MLFNCCILQMEIELEEQQQLKRCLSTLKVCCKVMAWIMDIAYIVVGAVYLYDCPIQPYIPIYLIVMGVISMVLRMFSLLPCTADSSVLYRICSHVIHLFRFCWFITGNVWIYSIYEPNYIQAVNSTGTYCNKTLYLFAFWTTILEYISLGVCIYCWCCLCIVRFETVNIRGDINTTNRYRVWLY